MTLYAFLDYSHRLVIPLSSMLVPLRRTPANSDLPPVQLTP